ncbi:MAG: NPCBM/NEW2 domain-containing protein, partial [Planctomycetota bacterium]
GSLLKVPACLADLAIAIVLYVEGRRLLGSVPGAAASALYFLNPVTIYNSAYWGQVDAIHTAFVLAAIVCVSRKRWALAGVAMALALLQKFQAIAFLPLVALEIYRLARWRGIARGALAGAVMAVVIALPFAWHGALGDALQRGYVKVIGQYNELSHNAYNVWYLTPHPETYDTTAPYVIARAAAQGSATIPDDASRLLLLSWRNISLIAYSLCVAAILSLYSLRTGAIARLQAAGLLSLAFFLVPTEMHERYSFPAIAMFALWAASSPWRERAFVLLSVLCLLNLTDVQPARSISTHIAGANVLMFIVIAAWLLLSRNGNAGHLDVERKTTSNGRTSPDHATQPAEPTPPPSRLITWFRRLTLLAWLTAGAFAGWLGHKIAVAPPTTTSEATVYLSTLTPTHAEQGWRTLATDRSVAGGLIHLDDTYYLHGLGTHAPARITYTLPEGYEFFETLVGIKHTNTQGSATVSVHLDGRQAYLSPRITGSTEPLTIRVPLDGARRLTLRVDPTSDGKRADHVDWAGACLTRQLDQLPVSVQNADD